MTVKTMLPSCCGRSLNSVSALPARSPSIRRSAALFAWSTTSEELMTTQPLPSRERMSVTIEWFAAICA